MATGAVEVHVDSIVRVQKIYRHDASMNGNPSGKRRYSTTAAKSISETGNELRRSAQNIVTALTSTECKFVNNNPNLVQWFIERKHTCGSLRVSEAGKQIILVGWIDKKQIKFVHLMDGYGSTQILLENDALRSTMNDVKENDLVVIHGRVLARPTSHVTYNSATGDIELYAEKISVLDPNVPYEAINTSETEECKTSEIRKDDKLEKNINEYTYRSHNCGELREIDIGKEVTLCGWLEFSRMKRFFTLRDGYGQTQVIIPDNVRDYSTS